MSATNNLRFIERDGKKILQQEHFLPFCIDPWAKPEEAANYKIPTEWRDVPLVTEDKQEANAP